MTSDCCVLQFLHESGDGKRLMCFQSEISVFKFLLRSVWTGPWYLLTAGVFNSKEGGKKLQEK